MDTLLSTWLLAILALFYVIYKLSTRPFDHFKILGLPYEKPWPLFGNMAPFAFRTNSFGDIFMDVYRKHPGHSLIGFFQFMTPMVMVCDPDIIKLITVKDFDHFTDHVTPLKENDDPLFGKVIFALEGERWKQMRNTLTPAYTSAKMKSMFVLVSECGEQLAEYLDKKIQGTDGLLELEMKDLFSRYANDVIATAAFGIHVDSLEQPRNEFYLTGKKLFDFGGVQALKMVGFLLTPRFMKFLKIQFAPTKVHHFFHSLVTDTMAQREKERIIRPDMIHLLMEAKRETLRTDAADSDAADAKKKFELSDEDIVAQAFLFFLAGFETTSVHLCFLVHLLAVHPDVQRRVQTEIDDVLAAEGGKLTYEGISKMKYLDMCISETLRLWPPAVTTDRVCTKSYVIPATTTSPSIKLSPGDAISLPVYALHRDSRFFPDPDKFDPERFSEERKREIQPFTYIPFGAGPRVCIGQRFALMETKIALTSLLTRFDIVQTAKTQQTLILNKKSFNMGVESGFWLGLKKRTKSM